MSTLDPNVESSTPTKASSTSTSMSTSPPASASTSTSTSTSNPQSIPQTTPSATPAPQNAPPIAHPIPKSKPFPSITGGCVCNTIRYRLLTSPLFCYACHCTDCQRTTGSAFGHFLNIETYNIHIISGTAPVHVAVTKRAGSTAQDGLIAQQALISRHVECPNCKVELWSTNGIGPMIADVRVGTLDFPSLMEPDVHAFVESKVEWLRLPDNARTSKGHFGHKKMWPESSLERLDVCLDRWARREAAKSGEDEKGEEGGDGEKTPTAGELGEGEDDEAFEKRFERTERMLQERLEVVRRKLDEEDGRGEGREHLEMLTEKLNLADGGSEEMAKVKDDIPSEPVD